MKDPTLLMQNNKPLRLRVIIHGAVQGVGFRPFIYKLARRFNLNGWVQNSCQGVVTEVEGQLEQVNSFFLCLEKEKPANAIIQSIESFHLDPSGYQEFKIIESNDKGKKTSFILPDIATCPECIDEIFDPFNHRHLYPFTNCTHCGPRFSIIEALPYDRRNTTMKKFQMCETCQKEYENPLNRRFHAQPNACPECGPHLELWNCSGETLLKGPEAMLECSNMIRQGHILAIKGLGGFHLAVRADSDEAVLRLRKSKFREEKPFALMYPSPADIKRDCLVSPFEERLLLSAAKPIVLLRRKDNISVSGQTAPQNPYLGVMLAYTPLHHILMNELQFPIVATSGNLSDEPVITDEYQALRKLGRIADFFLVHDRPIARHVDDSIVRMMAGKELILRRARGYAPLPVTSREIEAEFLSVGGHLKNTIALSKPGSVFLSQHIGNLETVEAFETFQKVIGDMQEIYALKPNTIACDLHPDYLSTEFAKSRGLPVVQIQHHYAHILSCMAENEVESPVLGIAWDGTGFGPDGTIWGGEFLQISDTDFTRLAHFKTFQLPGGDKAAREPRRSALGLLHQIYGDEIFDRSDLASLKAFSNEELSILRKILGKNLYCPNTSSAGRIFDAVSSLLNLRQISHYEGQAAMELEFLAEKTQTKGMYSFEILPDSLSPLVRSEKEGWQIDLKSVIQDMLEDISREIPCSEIAAKFHNTLVEIIVSIAKKSLCEKVVLSGGCFQNRYLTELSVSKLKQEGFFVYTHQRIPPNDGGIALGQILGLSRAIKKEMASCA